MGARPMPAAGAQALPLAGLRVVDFGQGVAGPYCGQLLGDHGADVIKMEPPRGDWGRAMGIADERGVSGVFISVNRNKRGLCLDLKNARAIDIARRLALRADIVVESFRDGVMARLGLGYEDLRRENPGIVYVAITGFGRDGPNAGLPAGDSTMQAYGGLMSIVGTAEGDPLRVGNVVSDMIAGTNAFSGTLLALLRRNVCGAGSRVDVSLLDSIVAFQAPPLTEYLVTGQLPRRAGNEHPLLFPSGAMRTSDSALVFTVLDHQWGTFCQRLGIAALENDARFCSSALRQQNRAALRAELQPIFARSTTAQWLIELRECDVLCAPIHDYAALLDDPQVRHNELVQAAADDPRIPLIRNPVRLSDTQPAMRPPPRIGEHTREVLIDELGMDAGEVEAFIEERIAFETGGGHAAQA